MSTPSHESPQRRVLFLPGAGGDPEFWRPVGQRLPDGWEKVYFGWPGLGDQPADPSVRGLEDLVDRVAASLDGQCDLVAQSMGGVVAVLVASRFPASVPRLVLVATSGGVDMARFGAEDWRPDYRRDFAAAADWITDGTPPDQTDEIAAITAPTLLIWGDADPISPVAVGHHLASLLPDSTLHVVAGGTHSVARDRAPTVADLIAAHLL